MPDVIATACSNVALVKYWGKRASELNLPYTGSISVTLDGMETIAEVTRLGSSQSDIIQSAGADISHRSELSGFVSLVRELGVNASPVHIRLESNFPIAAGLASSASTFAALACALSQTFGLSLTPRELSILARRGSGSAARSIAGGFVEWFAGERSDGADSYAEQICDVDHFPVGVVVAVTHKGPKAVSSRLGMQHVSTTSPFFPAWLESHEADLDAARRAISARDFTTLGEVAEHNCLKMHAVSLAARPALIYWNPATLAVIGRVRQLHDAGMSTFVTIDAGPQVKVLCPLDQRDAVAQEISRVEGVQQILLSRPGAGAQIVESR